MFVLTISVFHSLQITPSPTPSWVSVYWCSTILRVKKAWLLLIWWHFLTSKCVNFFTLWSSRFITTLYNTARYFLDHFSIRDIAFCQNLWVTPISRLSKIFNNVKGFINIKFKDITRASVVVNIVVIRVLDDRNIRKLTRVLVEFLHEVSRFVDANKSERW